MAGFEFDTSELDKLVADLGKVPGRATKDLGGVVEKGANNIKKDWQRRWSGLSHLPALANSISYDVKTRLNQVEAEIGPDKSRPQGPLGNVIEFGTSNNAPQPGGMPALAAEVPRFEKALGDLVEEVLE